MIRLAIETTSRSRRRCLLACCLVAMGCSREHSRDELLNRKALDALLTAITLHDPKELDGDAELLEQRRAAGQISDEHYQTLAELIAQARRGEWLQAEDGLYRFRQEFPFIR